MTINPEPLRLLVVRDAARALSQPRREALAAQLATEVGSTAATWAFAHAEDTGTLKDSLAHGQAQNGPLKSTSGGAARAPRSGRVHLIIGPVGAGKSTFGLGLARDFAGIRLTLDAWMVELFSRDRPDAGVMEWYVERAARCIEQIWKVASEILEAGIDVILEIGLLQRRERERFYQRVGAAGLELVIYVLDAAREVRRQRVSERNRTHGATFSMVVPPAIFELASDLWEPPDAAERERRDVRFIRTDAP